MQQETENLYVNGPSIDQLVSGHVSHYSGEGGGGGGRNIGTVNPIIDSETQHRPGPETNRRNRTESKDSYDPCFLDLNKDIKRTLK